MLARIRAAYNGLHPIARTTIESAALAVGISLVEAVLGASAPASPVLAFVLAQAKVAAPIVLLTLKALQRVRPAPAEVQTPAE